MTTVAGMLAVVYLRRRVWP
ncbi:PGF-CTERM sorting domain-containing protein [uncultured Methanomethylovorans sp.]